MSIILHKPCTVEERDLFIMEYGGHLTRQIYENDEAVYALEPNEIIQDGEVIIDPDYEQKQAEAEQQRIASLKVTKRVFALALQEMGKTYTQLKELIATNEQAQLEWDLCVELERSNPLLDVMAAQLGVSHEMLNYIFQKANGEDVDPPSVSEE